MLAFLDRNLRFWHVVGLNGAAIAWFAGMTIASQMALPNVSLSRCPIGFCATGYSADRVNLMLRVIGPDGRTFLEETLLPLDRVLPMLLLVALGATYAWLTRPGADWTVPLEPKYRYMLLAVPLFYCVADLCENRAFAQMLASFPQIGYREVRTASIFTSLKSQLIAASLGIAMALAIVAWVNARRSGKDG